MHFYQSEIQSISLFLHSFFPSLPQMIDRPFKRFQKSFFKNKVPTQSNSPDTIKNTFSNRSFQLFLSNIYCECFHAVRKLSTLKYNFSFLTFSSYAVKHCSPPSLFITCATPTTSPLASFIGMQRSAFVLKPVTESISQLKRLSCVNENEKERKNDYY